MPCHRSRGDGCVDQGEVRRQEVHSKHTTEHSSAGSDPAAVLPQGWFRTDGRPDRAVCRRAVSAQCCDPAHPPPHAAVPLAETSLCCCEPLGLKYFLPSQVLTPCSCVFGLQESCGGAEARGGQGTTGGLTRPCQRRSVTSAPHLALSLFRPCFCLEEFLDDCRVTVMHP